MLILTTHRNSVVAYAKFLTLAVLLTSIAARAQSSPASYAFLIGSGFLCDADFGACPAVVKSASGDTYEMSGVGVLDPQQESVTAAGTFTHRSRDGNALETGIWIAGEFVKFDAYGAAPGVLFRGVGLFGPASFGPARSRMFTTSIPAGGLAVFHVCLLPMQGASKTATLEVNYALGRVSADHASEGIRFALDGSSEEFSEAISGRTLFVLTGPGVSALPKPPARPAGTDPAPAETQ